ncbi:uncharacterized protein NECHADRAFT_90580 [Fusarium vanettenii 77-13-4]|uniref:C2H2-type domain-containing protein n=1 Tax=Fusarium vanettenii (strain ATCC MYA-4622 / CBS 123669 / FGSC 9596 / NRRL 45880 / 77-13-4) TaxID=660122 RepID=C7YJR9_FUSV7|nr:uncharacterized protein NECHADRAFT_90580 [Fusarium vanettenii 77-13-4]EEU48323.1 hypothetical protein NECHADRAFT_90580 [Fusarium vanettenii 77-13-4]
MTTHGGDAIRPRRRRRGDPHICPHCTRVFKRSEHLGRHVRTHTKEKPFVCTCGAAFARRDLLTRHQRISLHTGEAENPLPSPTPDVLPADPQAYLDPDAQQDLTVTQETFDQCRSLNSQTHWNSLIDCGQFWEFAGFLDGIGLPAEWSPYFHGPDGHETTSGEASKGNPPARGARLGTPFNSWLPSVPAGDRAPETHFDQDSRAHEAAPSVLRVTDEQRARLSHSLDNFRDVLDPDFRLPSRHALARYITSYIDGFHSHMVFMHVQTWSVLDSPLELVLSIATIGAQYCFEHRIAERLFHAAKAITFERLLQEAHQFGPKTASLLCMQGRIPRKRPDGNSEHERFICGTWEPIDTVRALINIMGYATWEMKQALIQEAFSLQGLLIQVLRDLGLEEEEEKQHVNNDSDHVSLQARWLAWVHQESVRRSKYIAFTFTHTHSIAYNVYPPLRTNEIHLRLPCHTKEWLAPTATAWQAAHSEVKKQQLSFQETLSLLLRNSECELNPTPTPIGNYILLHGLLQRIYVVRDLSLPIMDQSASLPPDEVDKLDRALRSWTTSWQQAPESSLDPNNENGPIPFTSSSLLGLAYVRIYLNIGPHRLLETRDPEQIAQALMKCPNVERSDGVISALLYAAHALSIPVRLGVDRVARSQAFFWSVRHSLSALECAVLLSKWLASLQRSVNTVSLNASEDRMLHWVRCIVEEAFSVVDFEEEEVDVQLDPRGLSLAVLNIWAHFFKSNTQWRTVTYGVWARTWMRNRSCPDLRSAPSPWVL